jgi:hypothetical protein
MSQKVMKTWNFASQQNHGKILYLAYKQNEWFYRVILPSWKRELLPIA